MYPVSQAYIDYMDQDTRQEPVKKEMELLRLDAEAQAGAEVTGYDGVAYGGMTVVSVNPITRKAALEQDYMRADGTYILGDADYYISLALSSSTPDDEGLYSITGGITVTLTQLADAPKEITLRTDPAVAKISVTQGEATAEYTATDGMYRIAVGGYGDVSITITAMYAPNRRAHLYRVYMGRVDVYSDYDIISLSYTDINDGVCLELPQKTISVAVNNIGGRYDPDTEYTNPTFRRFHTQALIRLMVGGEMLPLGRVFLDTYTVDSTSVTFNFVGPLSVLNEYTHWWSSPSTKYLHERIQEIVNPGLTMTDIGTDKPIKTGAEQFGITANASGTWWYKIKTPPPPLSGAQALQLLCNLTGSGILQGRPWTCSECTGEGDLNIAHLIWTGSPRQIKKRYLYTVKRSVSDAVGKIAVDVSTISSATESVTLAENMPVHVTHDDGVYTDLPISSVTIPPENADVYAYNVAMYAYSAYYRARNDSYITASPVTAQVKKIIKTPAAAVYGDGVERRLSNPLLCDDTEISAQNYMDRMRGELKHNLCYEMTHRGYPEIDAGETVQVQPEEGGAYVTCRVLENRVTIKNGAMRGTTKARRME